jgi:hypothetical protein
MATQKQSMRTFTVRELLADGFPNPIVPQPCTNDYHTGPPFHTV